MERNVVNEVLRLGSTMEQDEVADCANEEEEAMMIEDVADVTTMEDELEIVQVGPGSCSLQTWMDEDTHMEEPHGDDISTIDTCVSLENLGDEPYARKSKVNLLMLGRILPWMTMMRPCMEK